MNRDTFEDRYRSDWVELEILLLQLESKKTTSSELAQFPELYRRVCQQLALVRARGYGTDLERRLNNLALRGHQQLYRGQVALRRVTEVLGAAFPQTVRNNSRAFWLATALYVIPLLSIYFAIQLRPELVYSVLPAEQVAGIEESYANFGSRESSSDFLMFGFYIRNNVSIDFRTFAGGMLFGVGTVFFLFYNGLVHGSVFSHLEGVGLGDAIFPFVVGHSSFELTGMVLSGLAGLRIGGALLMPGRRSRLQALRETALEMLPVLYGTAAFTIIAAFIEAFWSSTPTAPFVRYAVGAVLWLLVAFFLLFAGRRQ